MFSTEKFLRGDMEQVYKIFKSDKTGINKFLIVENGRETRGMIGRRKKKLKRSHAILMWEYTTSAIVFFIFGILCNRSRYFK